ncbi:PLP-dependent aminotransferase family protein [Paenibacillus sp. sptzw28]|uniref:MocR-like pyridoxine biosynthesis transcription factor PdxR n=1 Tax=Paenibacillus sp. sptzw28 TaxID=715179 RepID=UPI00216326F8|nr:PLP-dependent aminotransferase family protein [Paenibacillus sp. sptzw28]
MESRIAFDRYYRELGRKSEALFQALREAIVEGVLTEGMRLPSSRKLAELYNLSRGSVNQAYEMLIAEGFVRTEAGSGTFVAFRVSETAEARRRGEISSAPIALSGWAQRLEAARRPDDSGGQEAAGQIDFNIGQVDPGLFPVEGWKTSLYAEIREMMDHWPIPAAPLEGYMPLREAIAHELRRSRGIDAEPSHLFITNGSMQAIALLSLLLVSPGSAVVLENPGYPGTKSAVQAAGGSIIAAPVDDCGIVPADWAAQLLFVTPTRHFPSGAVLTAGRRKELLEWAGTRGAVIVEDDYDSELRWGGRPAEPLKALDREGRVVYLGTFSKTMYSDLRIGYAVLPESLVEPFRRAKALLEPLPSGMAEQRALANFMASGGYARHLRRMRRVCGRRLIRFQEQMNGRLERWFRWVETDAGLHLYAQWRGEAEDYARFQAACGNAGVRWSDGGRFWIGKREYCSALFGFSHLTEEMIELGASRMEEVAKSLFE